MLKHRRIWAAICCLLMLVGIIPAASAADTLQPGRTYALSGSLSCYVNAMGGIEFADGLLSGITVTVDSAGNASMTLSLGVSTGTIYTVDYVAFVDAEKSAPGWYDSGGTLHRNASYTTGRNTATDSGGNRVRYVTSVTFPISTSQLQSTYTLYLYIESNVMGVQFCNGKGTGTSNTPGAATPYAAKLTVDWGTLRSGPAQTSGRDAAVIYTADTVDAGEGQYLLTVPARIVLDVGENGSGSFVFRAELTESGLSDGVGIRLTLPPRAELRREDEVLAAEVTLGETLLTQPEDTVFGAVTLSDAPAGHYVGIVDFSVSLIEPEPTEEEA